MHSLGRLQLHSRGYLASVEFCVACWFRTLLLCLLINVSMLLDELQLTYSVSVKDFVKYV